MGNKTLIYKIKVKQNLKECKTHLNRLNEALNQLKTKYSFPIDYKSYERIINNIQDLAYSDQIIYRFSKLQDTMGAKLFKSLLLYQGENVNKPFLDILNSLEKIEILNVEKWFEIRDLRNEIAHEYEENEQEKIDMLNLIYDFKNDLEKILNKIESLLH